MSNASIKEEARGIIEGLPPNATWEDLQYEIFVRQKIEAGLADARDGRTVSQAEVRRQFGQPKAEKSNLAGVVPVQNAVYKAGSLRSGPRSGSRGKSFKN